jgi:hypothetical protein
MNEICSPPEPLNTAVLFLVFNRPDTTAQVFEAIRSAKPPRLYVAADGPREGREDEAERTAIVREIATAADWPCEVNTLFRDKNLGCKHAVSAAIDWFFKNEERGIILEDDCCPHPDFFLFCETLLEKYENDARVWMITGNNFQDGQIRGNASYYFSKYSHIWGWASWRRAWNRYDVEMNFWSTWRTSNEWLLTAPDPVERRYWERTLDAVRSGKIDTWDYQWQAALFHGGGLCATPNLNLVSNIGFGPDATHTTDVESAHSNLKVVELGSISHPNMIAQSLEADLYDFDNSFGGKFLRFPRSVLQMTVRICQYTIKKVLGR